LLAGAGRPNYRDTVVANAAAALVVAGRAASLREGAALAADSLAAGAASLALSAFVDLTRSAA
jgi:anthranilate phosphoribosyltransferase